MIYYFLAILVIFFILKNYLKFRDSQTSKVIPYYSLNKYDLSDKVIILTGGTDGIGKEMARILASFNPKRLIIPARDKQKGMNLINYIKSKNGTVNNIELWDMDLANLQSVNDFADKFIKEVGELHMLFNNAGTMIFDKIKTKDNLEMHFQVNHLSPFLLTLKLLDTMKKSATLDSPAKISFTTSAVNRFHDLEEDDLYLEYTKSNRSYSYTKSMNIMTSNEIARRYKDSNITSCSSHPGLMITKLFKAGTSMGKLIIWFLKCHTEPCEQGAVNVLYPVLCKDIDDNGKYFDKASEEEPNKSILNEFMCRKIWDISVNSLKERGFLKEYEY